MTYLVTGATGFIGGRVVQRLVAAGHRVRALARDLGKARSLEARGVSVIEGDVTDRTRVRAAMRGADGVFHLAAWKDVGAPRHRRIAEAVNVEGTRIVLELMRELDVAKGVHTSTLAVFPGAAGRIFHEGERPRGPWPGAYARTKWRAQYEIAQPMMETGLPLVVVLPSVVYGPGDPGPLGATLVRYVAGRLPALPAGTIYSWTYVDDAAEGHVLAMERGCAGESYILAGPAHSLRETFGIAERITGIPAPRRVVSRAVMRSAATAAVLLGRFVRLPAALAAESLRMSAGVTYVGDSARARRELGWQPRSLEDGLRATFGAGWPVSSVAR